MSDTIDDQRDAYVADTFGVDPSTYASPQPADAGDGSGAGAAPDGEAAEPAASDQDSAAADTSDAGDTQPAADDGQSGDETASDSEDGGVVPADDQDCDQADRPGAGADGTDVDGSDSDSEGLQADTGDAGDDLGPDAEPSDAGEDDTSGNADAGDGEEDADESGGGPQNTDTGETGTDDDIGDAPADVAAGADDADAGYETSGAAENSTSVDDGTNMSVDPSADGGACEGPQPKPEIIGSAQSSRAADILAKMAPDDQARVQKMLDGAKSDDERSYLNKALASGHTPDEIAKFQQAIDGQDAKWMQDNLSLVGASDGSGIKQQWSHSCAPTTVEAVKGMLDPIYALQMRTDNKDVTAADDKSPNAANPQMAADQKNMLVSGGGTPASRDKAAQGAGMWGTPFNYGLDQAGKSSNVSFDGKLVGPGYTPDNALQDMDGPLKGGVPVPIVVGSDTSNDSHAALVTAVDDGPPRSYSIHDPYAGKTMVVTEDQFKNGTLNVAGWPKLKAVFKPNVRQ